MQIRLKIRCPAIDKENSWWLRGSAPLGTVWFQVALMIPAIFGIDLEIARANA